MKCGCQPEYTFTPTSRPYTNVTADDPDEDYTGTYTPDLDPPTPDPMTWAVVPAATGPYSITMTATTATDSSGVEYYFQCTAGGGNDSGWQDSTTYEDTGLQPTTEYTYQVWARDKSPAQNATAWSGAASATTQANPFPYKDIPVIMYHKVDDVTPTTYWVSVDDFRDQMFLLRDLGYETVNFEDLRNHIIDVAELPTKPIIVTFDDAYENAYTHALPVMQEFTEPDFFGVAHIITDVIGDDEGTRQLNLWDQPPEPDAWQMIWPEVTALYNAGWAIEAHSRTHLHDSDPAYDPVYEAGSAAVIASSAGIPEPNFYCYPFGESPSELITALENAGYLGGMDASGGIENTGTTDIWHIKRIGIMRDDTLAQFASKIGESGTADNIRRLTVNTVGNGSVELNPDRPFYYDDDEVTLTAIAEPPYEFDSWSGNLTGSTNPDTITIAGDMTVTATFVTPTAPTITSTPVTTAYVGLLYTYDVDATGYPQPTYSLDTFPGQVFLLLLEPATGSHLMTLKVSVYPLKRRRRPRLK